MEEIQTTAIILRSLPFRDHQKIISAFSKELGMIGLIIKGLSSKKSLKLPFCEPFCEAELVLSKKGGDLFLFKEGSVIDLHLPLRNDLAYIKTSSLMAKAILGSQLPEKPSPSLYTFLTAVLRRIPTASCQKTLLACFYLKLLKHEGIYNTPHVSRGGTILSERERALFLKLAEMRNFSRLEEESVSEGELALAEEIFFEQTKG